MVVLNPIQVLRYAWPKPDPAGYLDALGRLGATPAEAVVVGDNPHHDMAAAHAIGARAIRVLGGRFASVPAPAGAEPDLEIADIGALEAALYDRGVRIRVNAGYAEGVAAHA